jgi:branched-chain amino acid transport system substrate-binding protein
MPVSGDQPSLTATDQEIQTRPVTANRRPTVQVLVAGSRDSEPVRSREEPTVSNHRLPGGALRASAIGLVSVAIAACGQSVSKSGGGGGSAAGVTKATVMFGQTAPSSGPAALYGESTAGVKAYFDLVNSHGGVDGRKLKLTSLDDQYEPPVAVQQTRKLLSQGELAEVAVNGSATSKAVLNVLKPQGVPVIGPQSGATFLFAGTQPTLFNVWPQYTIEGKLLGNFAKHLGLKKVGVLYQDDDFGQSLYQGVKSSGLKPAKVISYDPTQTDFGPQAQKFKSAGVDGVIILAIPKPTIAFLNALAGLNFKPARLMSQVSAIPQSFSAAPKEFPGSYIGAFVPPLQSSSSQVTQFKQAMHTYQPGAPVSVFAAWGWTEAQVAVAGLKQVKGKLTRQSYAQGLDSVSNLQTLGGTLSYSSSDHVGLEKMFMVQARNGQLSAIK